MESYRPMLTIWSGLAFMAAAGSLAMAFGHNDLWTSEVPAAWLQAVGSIAAVGSGFVFVWMQERARQREANEKERDLAVAAGWLARDSIELAKQRLLATLESIDGKTLFALRGDRTTEMVQSMRELEVSTLPSELVRHYSTIRSNVYAVNRRISDIYDAEKKDVTVRPRRRSRLESSARILKMALDDFSALRQTLASEFSVTIEDLEISDELRILMQHAENKRESDPDTHD